MAGNVTNSNPLNVLDYNKFTMFKPLGEGGAKGVDASKHVSSSSPTLGSAEASRSIASPDNVKATLAETGKGQPQKPLVDVEALIEGIEQSGQPGNLTIRAKLNTNLPDSHPFSKLKYDNDTYVVFNLPLEPKDGRTEFDFSASKEVRFVDANGKEKAVTAPGGFKITGADISIDELDEDAWFDDEPETATLTVNARWFFLPIGVDVASGISTKPGDFLKAMMGAPKGEKNAGPSILDPSFISIDAQIGLVGDFPLPDGGTLQLQEPTSIRFTHRRYLDAKGVEQNQGGVRIDGDFTIEGSAAFPNMGESTPSLLLEWDRVRGTQGIRVGRSDFYDVNLKADGQDVHISRLSFHPSRVAQEAMSEKAEALHTNVPDYVMMVGDSTQARLVRMFGNEIADHGLEAVLNENNKSDNQLRKLEEYRARFDRENAALEPGDRDNQWAGIVLRAQKQAALQGVFEKNGTMKDGFMDDYVEDVPAFLAGSEPGLTDNEIENLFSILNTGINAPAAFDTGPGSFTMTGFISRVAGPAIKAKLAKIQASKPKDAPKASGPIELGEIDITAGMQRLIRRPMDDAKFEAFAKLIQEKTGLGGRMMASKLSEMIKDVSKSEVTSKYGLIALAGNDNIMAFGAAQALEAHAQDMQNRLSTTTDGASIALSLKKQLADLKARHKIPAAAFSNPKGLENPKLQHRMLHYIVAANDAIKEAARESGRSLWRKLDNQDDPAVQKKVRGFMLYALESIANDLEKEELKDPVLREKKIDLALFNIRFPISERDKPGYENDRQIFESMGKTVLGLDLSKTTLESPEAIAAVNALSAKYKVGSPAWRERLAELQESKLYTNTKVEVLGDWGEFTTTKADGSKSTAPGWFTGLVQDIRNAKHTINLGYWAIDGEYGEKLVEELKAKHAKDPNVHISLMVDKMVSNSKGGESLAKLEAAGITVTRVPRFHEKFAIIDDTVITGDKNVEEEYAEKWYGKNVKMSGDVVKAYYKHAEDLMQKAGTKYPYGEWKNIDFSANEGDVAVSPVFDVGGDNKHPMLNQKLFLAGTLPKGYTLVIDNAYNVSSEYLRQILHLATSRGVNVQIVQNRPKTVDEPAIGGLSQDLILEIVADNIVARRAAGDDSIGQISLVTPPADMDGHTLHDKMWLVLDRDGNAVATGVESYNNHPLSERQEKEMGVTIFSKEVAGALKTQLYQEMYLDAKKDSAKANLMNRSSTKDGSFRLWMKKYITNRLENWGPKDGLLGVFQVRS